MSITAEADVLLERKRALEMGAAPQLKQRLAELRAWQAARLARTYSDLHAETRFRAAIEFFLNDLYGPHDFARRDEELARAWRRLGRVLPRSAVQTVTQAVELDLLSTALDHALAGYLCPGALTDATYAQAYRQTGQEDSRRRQIELIVGIGKDLNSLANRSWARVALKAAHVPAHAAGLGTLQDFLERGYESFRRIGDARYLLETIRERETLTMRALFDGAPDPFQWAGRSSGARR